jgi:hypothetical protein
MPMPIEIDTDLMTADQLADAIDDRLNHVRMTAQFIMSVMGRRNMGAAVAITIRMGLRDLIDAERNLTAVAAVLRGECCDDHKHDHDDDR